MRTNSWLGRQKERDHSGARGVNGDNIKNDHSEIALEVGFIWLGIETFGFHAERGIS